MSKKNAPEEKSGKNPVSEPEQADRAEAENVLQEEREPAEAENTGEPAGPERGEMEKGISAELSECRESLLRIAAEYDNFRKRTARERETMFGNITADTAALFLPVLDNLGRAVSAPTSDASYAQGVVMIEKQFLEVLAKLGVEEIDALGKPFDSGLHNAVMHVEQEGLGESVVAEVFQKGYRMGDRVLRHSVVKVAN